MAEYPTAQVATAVARELGEMDKMPGTEGIVAAALLLVAGVDNRALRRTDAFGDRIIVSRSQILRLLKRIDETHPGLRERAQVLAQVDKNRIEPPIVPAKQEASQS